MTKEEKTPEQLQAEAAAVPADKETAAAFVADLIDGIPMKSDDKKEDKKPEKKEDRPRDEKGAFIKVEDKPKPKAKVRPQPEPREPDYEAIAEASARGVTKALQTPQEHKEPPKPAVDTTLAHLDETDRRRVPVLQKLQELFPERYKGIAEKFSAQTKAVADYQAKWEEENPGETFNPEDTEHNPFYEKHTVDWDDEDYTMALAELVAEKRTKEIEERTGKKLNELEQRDRARELWPKVVAEAKRVGKHVFNQIGGLFKDIIGDDFQVNRAVVQKIETEDPVGFEHVLPEVTRLENRAALNSQLFDGTLRFDPKDAEHQFISDFALASEKEMLSLSRDKRVDSQGRQFATSAEYHRMNELERSKHYTFTAQNLNDMLAAETAARLARSLKSEREKFRERAVRYGYLKPGSEESNGKPQVEEEPEEEEIEPTRKPKAVSAGTEAVTPPTVRGRDHQPQNPGSALLNELLT